MSILMQYKIPRKRKLCVIVYRDKIFDTAEKLVEYLMTVQQFSLTITHAILAKLELVDEATMRSKLKELGCTEAEIKKRLTGAEEVKETTKKKTTTKTKAKTTRKPKNKKSV